MKKILPFAILAVMLCSQIFAADAGAVTTGEQSWDGRKIMLKEAITSSTLTGATTVDKNSNITQAMDPGGASRNVTLDTSCNKAGYRFKFINTADAAENLVIKNSGGSTIITVGQNEAGEVFFVTGTTWIGYVYSNASSGFLPASGATTGATSQAQTFTNGVVLDAITGNTAGTPFAFAGKVGSSSAGQAVGIVAGAGNGANNGGAITVTGGASGAGATGAGGAASVTGGAAASTNGAGGAGSLVGGAGAGTGAGGAIAITGGASGGGATGNGGAVAITSGAATSTNGSGGAGSLVAGAATGTGTGGAITITSGASGGAGGTAGAITIDNGAPTGGTRGALNIGTTNAGTVTVGNSTGNKVLFVASIGATPATVQDMSTGGTITLPSGTFAKRLTASGGAATDVILTAGSYDGQILILLNADAANDITFAASGTSNVAGGTSAKVTHLWSTLLIWDNTTSLWYASKQ